MPESGEDALDVLSLGVPPSVDGDMCGDPIRERSGSLGLAGELAGPWSGGGGQVHMPLVLLLPRDLADCSGAGPGGCG